MATKRRAIARRRLGPAAEAAAWADVFETSFDFFDELEATGLPNGDDVAKRAAAEEAWHRLGAIFMANRDPAKPGRPWAVQEFGLPRGAT